jgi:hypothetical protein
MSGEKDQRAEHQPDADAEPSKTERPAFEEYVARLKADPNCIFVERETMCNGC